MDSGTSSACYEGQSLEDEHTDDWLFLSSDSACSHCLEVSRANQVKEDKGKLKSKFVSAWNSVKYGWFFKQKSNLSESSTITLLGNSFLLRNQGEKECFYHSFSSLLWLTYRRGFPKLEGSSLTTDSGWGCLLRTGQMLLAQGLFLHLVPQGLRSCGNHHMFKDDMDLPEIPPAATPACEQNLLGRKNKRDRKLSLGSLLETRMSTHRRVIAWFADHPTAPLGIHRLVELGKSSGKKAGDWYGPSIVAHILRKAVEASVDLRNLVVYVAQDCTIYIEDVKRLCEQPLTNSSTATIQPWKSVILLVPVRLGGQDLNPAYISCVKKLLKLQCCLGIIGGKPKHSLFFVGFQDDHILFLDPHYCQPTVDITRENFPLESFYCKYPRKMAFSRMDPSCTIGFYAKDQKDFGYLCSVVDEAVQSAESYPMFIFAEGCGNEEQEAVGKNIPPTNNVTYIQRKNKQKRVDPCNSIDEFVLL